MQMIQVRGTVELSAQAAQPHAITQPLSSPSSSSSSSVSYSEAASSSAAAARSASRAFAANAAKPPDWPPASAAVTAVESLAVDSAARGGSFFEADLGLLAGEAEGGGEGFSARAGAPPAGDSEDTGEGRDGVEMACETGDVATCSSSPALPVCFSEAPATLGEGLRGATCGDSCSRPPA